MSSRRPPGRAGPDGQPGRKARFLFKRSIFRSLASTLHQQSRAHAETELKSQADLATRVEAALLARIGPCQEGLTGSAHGSEICDEQNGLCGELAVASSERFEKLLATTLRAGARDGESDLQKAGINASVAAPPPRCGGWGGLKQGAADLPTFETRLHRFVRVFIRGLR